MTFFKRLDVFNAPKIRQGLINSEKKIDSPMALLEGGKAGIKSFPFIDGMSESVITGHSNSGDK